MAPLQILFENKLENKAKKEAVLVNGLAYLVQAFFQGMKGRLHFMVAADEGFTRKCFCLHCRRMSWVVVKKFRKRCRIRYIEKDRGGLHMRLRDIPVVYRFGYCSLCGCEIARPMFHVLNCNALCRAVELFKLGKKIEAIRVDDM